MPIKRLSNQLYRGPRPETVEALKELMDIGIKKIINLQSGFHEKMNDDYYENKQLDELGMKEINLQCSDFTPPKAWQVDRVLKEIAEGGPVYIHCLHGKDRTGFMCAVYRMQVQGWTYEEAKAEYYREGLHKFPYIWWLLELKKYAKS